MLITTYKQANQLQSSCISLPTVTVPVVTPHVYSVANYSKCKLMMCISHVLRVCLLSHMCMPKSCATVHAHAGI